MASYNNNGAVVFGKEVKMPRGFYLKNLGPTLANFDQFAQKGHCDCLCWSFCFTFFFKFLFSRCDFRNWRQLRLFWKGVDLDIYYDDVVLPPLIIMQCVWSIESWCACQQKMNSCWWWKEIKIEIIVRSWVCPFLPLLHFPIAFLYWKPNQLSLICEYN